MSGKNPGNVSRGLKAGISNPNNSEETKQDLRNRLQDMEESGATNTQEAHDAQVERGHKANLSNPNTSEESKERSQDALEQLHS